MATLEERVIDLAEAVGTDVGNLREEPLQWWQTYAYHSVGIGQQDLPVWIPYGCTLVKLRYRIKAAGTGGSLTCELRHTDPTNPANALAGTALTPAVSPSFTTLSLSLATDQLLWAYLTAVNDTPGTQLKVEALVVRT